MNQNEVYTYNPTPGKKGLEARYMLRGFTLYVKIQGSNHWWDFLECVLFAWPMYQPYPNNRLKAKINIRVHKRWWKMAEEFSTFLRLKTAGYEVSEYKIIGHSAGGDEAMYLSLMAPPRHIDCITVNSPNGGNQAFVDRLKDTASVRSLSDGGDVIHRWPFRYADNPNREEYGHTRGIGAAHNRKPHAWNEFPI